MTTRQMNHDHLPPLEHPSRDPGSYLLRRWETVQADELTVKELLVLVKYWTHVAIDAAFFEFSTTISMSCCNDHKTADANIRAVRRLLGKEVLDGAVLEAEQEYRRRCGSRAWNIFVNGRPAEVTAYQVELGRWYSEVEAASEPRPDLTSGDLDDVAF